MALTPETGAGLANADAYCSTTFADAWHSGRGVTLWATLTTQQKEQAIRRATDYMTQVYGPLLAGYRKTITQALDWPREDVPRRDVAMGYGSLEAYWPSDAVPTGVQQACAELAFRAASGDLAPDVDRIVKREKIDVIEIEYDTMQAPWVRYRAVDNMMAPFMSGGGFSMKVSRA